eukprot:gnl/MRDRNA2_/MRDRNA2_187964_c0_seq1.p1 gnl/MRDRNA2_/MRDRNA2_187964_c0~~gnl/MRDRNA2_/MRDRNA2_187964_c0_seq1.p1  ORF type:complete len:451 (+),score=71.16 gnl/MRDRNA2_/MRDRNA2_187964_c0_seq1:52-1353(+)
MSAVRLIDQLLIIVGGALLPRAQAVLGECSKDFHECRTELIKVAFGTLPTRSEPDFIFYPSRLRPNATGGQNEGIGPNTSTLVWTIRDGGLELNATIFYSLNTSGTAVADYPGQPDPAGPSQNEGQKTGNGDVGPRHYPTSITDTLVLYHNGHEAHWTDGIHQYSNNATKPLCVRPAVLGDDLETSIANCWINYDTNLGWLNELGYDAMELNMPLRGPNNNGSIGTMEHSWFEQWEEQGVRTMRFFVEPVFLAVNYAKLLGYKRIAMLGLSGGAWTTTVAAAADPRIGLSIPVAGSLPFKSNNKGDFEQLKARKMYDVCDFECMYVLGALEEDRQQLQVLHEEDPCCFAAAGHHYDILKYNHEVQQISKGYMCTAVTKGNVHEVNLRDKTLVASLLDEFDRGMLDLSLGCYNRPFNLLQQTAGPGPRHQPLWI